MRAGPTRGLTSTSLCAHPASGRASPGHLDELDQADGYRNTAAELSHILLRVTRREFVMRDPQRPTNANTSCR